MSANAIFKYLYSSLRALGVLTFFALAVANHEAPDFKNIFRSQADQGLVEESELSMHLVHAIKSGGAEFGSVTDTFALPVRK